MCGILCIKEYQGWKKVQELVPWDSGENLQLDDCSIPVPNPQLNVIYVFLHLQHHLLQIGTGLRQVCDWLCIWNAKKNEIDKELFLKCVNLLPIRRSMTALVWIAVNYMGFEDGIIPLNIHTRQAMRDGELLLSDILKMGNFGRVTDILEGFERVNHLHNLRAYALAFKRRLHLFKLCPSDGMTYPVVWVSNKLKEK
mgnify:FL=1